MLTRNPDDERLAALISAVGKGDAGAVERAQLEDAFKWIRHNYQTRLRAFEADVDHRTLLRKLLASIGKQRELRPQLAAIQQEIMRVGLIGMMDDEVSDEIQSELAPLMNPKMIERTERLEEYNIRLFLKTTNDYRKGALRKLVVEPFLFMTHKEEFELTFSRERPLTGAVEALFDFIGIDPKRRPDKSGVRTIAREIRSKLRKPPGQPLE